MRMVIFIMICLQSVNAYSHSSETKQSNYTVGRYSSVSTKPSQSQTELLSVIIEIEFPHTVKTVGSAMRILLLNSGYKLADIESTDPKSLILLNSTLPGVHRRLGPIALKSALKTLSGSPWDLIIDPVHRLISFDLQQNFKAFNNGDMK